MVNMDLTNDRTEHNGEILDSGNTPSNPVVLFNEWFQFASQTEMQEPNAMVLSTVANNRPSSRIVLLKSYSDAGFTFFTNYNSRKATEIETNNAASLLFYWDKLFRQIRIEGKTIKISREESVNYFRSRPKGSQISAVISHQSKIVKKQDARDYLINLWNEKFNQFQNKKISCPVNWGGFLLIPDYFEFWQGQKNRFHDRIAYKLDKNWKKFRLYP